MSPTTLPPSTTSKNVDIEELVAALLVIAGSWFILSKALEAANRSKGVAELPGDEWARKIVGEIDKAKKDVQDDEKAHQ